MNPKEEAAVVSPSALNILGSWENECLGSEGNLGSISQHPLQ